MERELNTDRTESTALLNVTQRVLNSHPVRQDVQRIEGKAALNSPGNEMNLANQFKSNLAAILNVIPSLTRNEWGQIRQIVHTAKEQNVSPQQAAQDLNIKLTTAQQELFKHFSGAVQNAVDAGISADEARTKLRETIGVFNIARHLLDLGQNARAQQIIDMYDKGATLNELHKQVRNWGYGDWVKEEIERLFVYESLITSVAISYTAQASQVGRAVAQSVGEQLRELNDYVNEQLAENKKKKEREEKEKEEKSQLSPEEKLKKKRSVLAGISAAKSGVVSEAETEEEAAPLPVAPKAGSRQRLKLRQTQRRKSRKCWKMWTGAGGTWRMARK